MDSQAVRMACAGRAGQTRKMSENIEHSECRDLPVCALLIEARSLASLGAVVVDWLAAHPTYAPLSLSHAAETRSVPVTGIAGPRSLLVYTGILLVRAGGHGTTATLPLPDVA